MTRPPVLPAEEKVRIVLSILAAEITVAEAARRAKVSERRHQARVRQDRPVRGPWPRPARDRVREAARRHPLARPAWGHRKVWAMCRHDGLVVSQASVLRLLRDEGLLLEANYQRERRQHAARRKAAFAVEPTTAN